MNDNAIILDVTKIKPLAPGCHKAVKDALTTQQLSDREVKGTSPLWNGVKRNFFLALIIKWARKFKKRNPDITKVHFMIGLTVIRKNRKNCSDQDLMYRYQPPLKLQEWKKSPRFHQFLLTRYSCCFWPYSFGDFNRTLWKRQVPLLKSYIQVRSFFSLMTTELVLLFCSRSKDRYYWWGCDWFLRQCQRKFLACPNRRRSHHGWRH